MNLFVAGFLTGLTAAIWAWLAITSHNKKTTELEIDHEAKQDACPRCGHKSDYHWPWCSPTGPGWGQCLECGAKSLTRLKLDQEIEKNR